ncbi:hypothetical protein OHS33_30635 [Streptomyces sp. NBC_00536]|uniref:hypothetical protein n=1 Tax=Streptomyces sp. NBC_00536 TaxID=2975769 RepID=UPI002E8199BC|nr:hypothetical protein [Streptomyces sp. NBC_00536]WUC82326.1 hypothetical protein OHS33_30635 [Streptomyces sp. NBC_00536]
MTTSKSQARIVAALLVASGFLAQGCGSAPAAPHQLAATQSVTRTGQALPSIPDDVNGGGLGGSYDTFVTYANSPLRVQMGDEFWAEHGLAVPGRNLTVNASRTQILAAFNTAWNQACAFQSAGHAPRTERGFLWSWVGGSDSFYAYHGAGLLQGFPHCMQFSLTANASEDTPGTVSRDFNVTLQEGTDASGSPIHGVANFDFESGRWTLVNFP